MDDALPVGTVTFLFTDVEGSTRLLEELGPEEYAVELGRHRKIVREALAHHGGVEVDTQGDAFFCSFASARSAVACAAGIQEGLSGGPVRVRMGIHTGEALVVDRHYVGMDVHRASRIGACGHGGQVVISPTTVARLEPGSFDVTELGSHRLKDLAAPVDLYQLGDVEFPPLKALFATNLPVPATTFLGRDRELEELRELASEQHIRLLTLIGPGGTGKTRLGLQLAAELSESFPGGIWWVPLAPVREAALVGSAVAEVLGVEEEAGRSLSSSIATALLQKQVLLVLDNCEHVLSAVAELVSAVLAGCRDVVVVTTSREALAVSGEQVFAVQPLASTDAVSLFDARARAAGAAGDTLESREVLAAVCERLDNLPLAVELAAARTAALAPRALLERLSSRLDVLKGPRDADERQRTLRATIAWSYDLLGEDERRVFRALSVFADGASLEAAETVCAAAGDELLSLVEKSLVRYSAADDTEPRYSLLETIREFAAERLAASAEDGPVRHRHASWYASRARDARGKLVGPGSNAVLAGLERDRENMRSALAWSLEAAALSDAHAERRDDAVALALVLGPVHTLHGRYAEAESAARLALELDPPPVQTAALQERLSTALRRQARVAEGIAALLEAERALESTGVRDDSWWRTWINVKLAEANHYYFEAELDALVRVIAELRPVVDERGSPVQRLSLLHVIAQDAYRRERYALSTETEELVREIYRLSLELEDDYAGFTLGFCLLWREKFDEAERYLQQGLESARARGDALVEVRCLVYWIVARRRRGDVEGARELLTELSAIEDQQRYQGLICACEAWVALRDRDLDRSSALAEEALAHWAAEPGRGGPTVFQWTARFPLLAVALERGQTGVALEQARALLDPSLQPLPVELAAALEAAVDEGRPGRLEAALELARRGGFV